MAHVMVSNWSVQESDRTELVAGHSRQRSCRARTSVIVESHQPSRRAQTVDLKFSDLP